MNPDLHPQHPFAAPRNRRSFGAASTLLLGILLAGVPQPRAQIPQQAPVTAKAPAPKPARERHAGDDAAKSLHAALSDASSNKRAAMKLDGAARDTALATVADQYGRIADDETLAAAGRAEAAFRAGDILRGLKHLGDAEARFHAAVELGQNADDGRDFAARALLELANMKRRANDVPGALALYAEVGGRFADQRRSAAHAATWTGKLLLKSGDRDKAEEVLMSFATNWPEYPAEAVRNADLVAVDQAEAGDEDVAKQTVARIRSTLEPQIAKGGQQAEAIQKAFDSMRVTEMIAVTDHD